ncbi:MAG: YkgJ family cysteine cluster protein [Treponema sp.]|jgi:Fe-S-cluster containining protein|nr:YkgJ family cysteine cluster protein [Treponema sp.]
MLESPFYTQGLHFSCTRCSVCCRYEPGFVFLSLQDLQALAAALKMSHNGFMETYCRWIPLGEGVQRLSLKENARFDCVFWKDGCSVYEARPLQCRTFPFWSSNLLSEDAWKTAGRSCPGVGQGRVYDTGHIEDCLKQEKANRAVTRREN